MSLTNNRVKLVFELGRTENDFWFDFIRVPKNPGFKNQDLKLYDFSPIIQGVLP